MVSFELDRGPKLAQIPTNKVELPELAPMFRKESVLSPNRFYVA